MDFTLNDEQRQIYEYGGQLAQKFDNGYWLEHARRKAFPREMFAKIAEDGFLGLMVPEEYGGAGLGLTEMGQSSSGGNCCPRPAAVISNSVLPLPRQAQGPTR